MSLVGFSNFTGTSLSDDTLHKDLATSKPYLSKYVLFVHIPCVPCNTELGTLPRTKISDSGGTSKNFTFFHLICF